MTSTCKNPSSLSLIALAVLLPLVAQGAPAARARIEITSEPPVVELGSGESVTLHITSAEIPVLTASVGEVRPPWIVSQGRYDAVYVPPTEKFPQVAIIVARSGRASGWLALPLAGSGEVTVPAGPDGMASVTVGKRQFGPQRAGEDGKAVVPIVVPPGTEYAVSGGKRLKLVAPEVPHLFLSVQGGEVPANLSQEIPVRVYAVTPRGQPRRASPLRLSAEPGTVSAPKEVEPGVYDATWSLPPGSENATLTARLAGEAPVRRVTVARGEPEPQKLRIEVDRPSVAAGQGTLDFTLIIEDDAGRPVEGVPPRATINTGTFVGWTRGLPGRWVGHIALPERLDARTLIIVATAGDLMARREVALVPGPVAELVLRGEPPSGEEHGTITVATLDRFGNPTDETAPEASASLGVVGTAVKQGPGTYRFSYRPPVAATASADEITVRAGLAERVLEVPLTRQREVTASRSGFSLGVKGGLALKSEGTGPALGAEAAYWGLGAGSQIGLVLDASYFKFSRDTTVGTPPNRLPLSSSASYLAFTLAPSWRGDFGGLRVWASVGGGLVRASSSSKLGTQPTLDESKWVPTGTAALSLGTSLFGGYPFVEARASYVGIPSWPGSPAPSSPSSCRWGTASMRSDRYRPLVALALAAAASCGGSSSGGPKLTLTSISPARGYTGDAIAVVVAGNFPPKVTVPQGGGAPETDYTYRASLGANALTDVKWSSLSSLTATVPPGLPAGTYDLTVENALGERGTLKAAYEVVETPPFSATATLSPSPAAIGEAVTLRLDLTNGGTAPITGISAGVPSQRTTDGGLLGGFTQAPPGTIDALAPGATLGLTWTTTPKQLGTVEVTVTATGTDGAGQPIDAVLAAPASILIAAVPPGAPTGVLATPSNGSATVRWVAPAYDGGSAITSYTVTSSPGGFTATTAGATSATVTGLTNGTSYRFTVTATNVAGPGPASGPSAAVTPSNHAGRSHERRRPWRGTPSRR